MPEQNYDPMTRNTNRLIRETSPYLLQHAHNPVDWYAWGEEALQKAKQDSKPIFLSIGYMACHWCHVMERESFENPEIAGLLNEDFICIKVDREERPDLDEIYMAAVLALTGSGGWPMTVFLTPDLYPFMGGTYFPPTDKWGRIGFKRLITRIAELWKRTEDRDKLLKEAEALKNIIVERTSGTDRLEMGNAADKHLLEKAVRELEAAYDAQWGGFGRAPKFPSPQAIAFLLRDAFHNGNSHSLRMATLTLDRMFQGGLYDHVGGGFHRYSTDDRWLVPHFEKMLYDNAQLAEVYLLAFQMTGRQRYARVAQEVLAYVQSSMTHPEGGFYSSEDADSEGQEGIFYLWSMAELESVLDAEDAQFFLKMYNVNPDGNFSSPEMYHRGLNILHILEEPASFADKQDLDAPELQQRLLPIKLKLQRVRGRRVRPDLDDKLIMSWNGLMISAFARGFQILGEEAYLQAAEQAAVFLTTEMRSPEAGLLRIHRKGISKTPAFLEDYAYVIRSLIDLYESSFAEKWILLADELIQEMLSRFWDTASSAFFNTGELHKDLIVRTQSAYDDALPSPTAVAVQSLFRMGKLMGNKDYLERAEHVLSVHVSHMRQMPRGYLSLLACAEFLIYPFKEIALVGDHQSPQLQALMQAVHRHFLPNRVIVFRNTGQPDSEERTARIPLLVDRDLPSGKAAAAFVCEDFVCRKPVYNADDLLTQLGVQKRQ